MLALLAPSALGGQVLMWTAERDGKTSTLLGTCHLPIPVAQALGGEPERIDRARVVLVEIADPPEAEREAGMAMFSRKDRLSARISPEAFDTLALLSRDAVPAPLIDRAPAFAASMFYLMEPGQAPLLDAQVKDRAVAAGVPVRGLETTAQQLALVAPFDDAFLPDLEPDQFYRGAPMLEAACGAGDVAKMARQARKLPYYDAFLADRNAAWLPVLMPELAEGDALVAVGFLHLVGKDGLLASLEDEGFTVTRVEAPLDAEVTVRPRPEVPPGTEEDRARWAEKAELFAGGMCAAPQVGHCFGVEPAACAPVVEADFLLCTSQLRELLPRTPGPIAPAVAERIAGCALAGLAIDAANAGTARLDDPTCGQ